MIREADVDGDGQACAHAPAPRGVLPPAGAARRGRALTACGGAWAAGELRRVREDDDGQVSVGPVTGARSGAEKGGRPWELWRRGCGQAQEAGLLGRGAACGGSLPCTGEAERTGVGAASVARHRGCGDLALPPRIKTSSTCGCRQSSVVVASRRPPRAARSALAQRIVAAYRRGLMLILARSRLGRPPSSPPSRQPPPPWRRPRGSAAGRSGQHPCAPVRGQQRGSHPRHAAAHACAAHAHAGPGATLWDRVSVQDPHLHALELRVQRVYRSLHRLERRLVVRRVHLHRAGSVSPQARASNRIDCRRGRCPHLSADCPTTLSRALAEMSSFTASKRFDTECSSFDMAATCSTQSDTLSVTHRDARARAARRPKTRPQKTKTRPRAFSARRLCWAEAADRSCCPRR